VLAWGSCLLTAVFVALGLLFYFLSDRGENTAHVVSELSLAGLALTAAVGALVTVRRAGNRIGGLLLVLALSLSIQQAAVTYVVYGLARQPAPPGVSWVAWTSNWVQSPGIAAILLVLLLYPTGWLPSPRWRSVAWAAFACGALGLTGGLLEPVTTLPDGRTVTDPIGVAALGRLSDVLGAGALLLLLLLLPGLAVAVVVRFRRARGIERAQLKWLAYAASVALVTLLIPNRWLGDWKQTTIDVVLSVGLPVAIGIAILRYRLYDIDHIINRTVVYGLLTAVLGGAYAAGVVALGALFNQGRHPSSLTVAAVTLAVAAVAQPARRVIQQAVDRRFNRRRYDATRIIGAFSARLRSEIDLDTLAGELLDVVKQTMQPTQASLWLRPPLVPATSSPAPITTLTSDLELESAGQESQPGLADSLRAASWRSASKHR
jgi:hypothetical protein